MKETMKQQKKKHLNQNLLNKENKLNEARINKALSRYFIWFLNNNIEEFQKICNSANKDSINKSYES